jgi:hypothetical protein
MMKQYLNWAIIIVFQNNNWQSPCHLKPSNFWSWKIIIEDSGDNFSYSLTDWRYFHKEMLPLQMHAVSLSVARLNISVCSKIMVTYDKTPCSLADTYPCSRLLQNVSTSYKLARYHIPEDNNHDIQCCENLRSVCACVCLCRFYSSVRMHNTIPHVWYQSLALLKDINNLAKKQVSFHSQFALFIQIQNATLEVLDLAQNECLILIIVSLWVLQETHNLLLILCLACWICEWRPYMQIMLYEHVVHQSAPFGLNLSYTSTD